MNLKWRLPVYAVLLLGAVAYTQWRVRPPQPLQVQVVAEGVVALDGQTMMLAEFERTLSERLRGQRQQPRIYVSVDAKAPSTVLIPVLDALTRSGAVDVQVLAAS
jgi:biopolymer transport protein ExbD